MLDDIVYLRDTKMDEHNSLSRRGFMKIASGVFASSVLAGCGFQKNQSGKSTARPNLMIITTDDMSFDSAGIFGCPVKNITPNLDQMAREGMRFEHAYNPISVCQPCRQSLLTGLYPHNNGGLGLTPMKPGMITLGKLLHDVGYYNVLMSKEPHYKPDEAFCWDRIVTMMDLIYGRDPQKFYQFTKEALSASKKQKKPFFIHLNTCDPHRPFAQSEQEKLWYETRRPAGYDKKYPPVSYKYSPEEVDVPGYLPDLPDIREEMAEYYTTLHRADDTIGLAMKALDEAGVADNTVVIHFGDNGASFPSAKQNTYTYSTRTALIIRWPHVIKADSVERDNMVLTLDIMPTLIEAFGLEQSPDMDGKSFLPILQGKSHKHRNAVYTTYNYAYPGWQVFPMRGLHTKKFSYIYNAWADGKTKYSGEPLNGLTYNAMAEAAKTDPVIAERLKFILYRVPEEFYDLQKDPWCQKNLIDDPAYKEQIAKMKARFERAMVKYKDPLLPKFRGEGVVPPQWYVSDGSETKVNDKKK